MNKLVPVFLAAACLVLVGSGNAQPNLGGVVKVRVFEGLREGSPTAQSITSSYLRYMLSAKISSDAALDAEQNVIKKTFNLKDVRLVTESSVKWGKGESQKAHHMFRLDGKLYELAVASRNALSRQFKVEVNEVREAESRNLLDTEFTIPGKNAAVFGFEDSNGKPYFISLREEEVGVAEGGVEGGVAGGVVGGVEGGVEGGVAGGVEVGVTGGVKGGVEGGVTGGGQKEGVEKRRQEFEKGAVLFKDAIPQPKLIKKVDPVYPQEAREKGIQGVVILEGRIDESGRVTGVMVLRSVPGLDEAARNAVKQWVYEPLVIQGKPRQAVFTVTVRFQLGEKEIEKFAEGAVKVKESIEPPQIIKKVDPTYPEAARKAGTQGAVILEARTDIDGRVKDVMVLRSIPALNQAAIDAVRQWVYEPLVIDGKPREAVFSVTVSFVLKKEKTGVAKEASETAGQAEPNVVKKVDPVYPEAARKAGIEGTVLLEAKTDAKGDVVAVSVLKSVPELDQAAIDALKQWKYEPYVVDGKPVGLVFTVTIRFVLK
jgi:TonB family protein